MAKGTARRRTGGLVSTLQTASYAQPRTQEGAGLKENNRGEERRGGKGWTREVEKSTGEGERRLEALFPCGKGLLKMLKTQQTKLLQWRGLAWQLHSGKAAQRMAQLSSSKGTDKAENAMALELPS